MARQTIPHKIRTAKNEDVPFIVSTWLNNYRKGSDFTKRPQIIPPIYFKYHHAVIERILIRQSCRAVVAHAPEDVDTILGFIVWETGLLLSLPRDIVHYIYVKEPFQGLGVASSLVTSCGFDPFSIYFTHHTRDRKDQNPTSPTFGKVRWRGAETLLKKWPMAYTQETTDKRHPNFVDGNLYVPWLI